MCLNCAKFQDELNDGHCLLTEKIGNPGPAAAATLVKLLHSKSKDHAENFSSKETSAVKQSFTTQKKQVAVSKQSQQTLSKKVFLLKSTCFKKTFVMDGMKSDLFPVLCWSFANIHHNCCVLLTPKKKHDGQSFLLRRNQPVGFVGQKQCTTPTNCPKMNKWWTEVREYVTFSKKKRQTMALIMHQPHSPVAQMSAPLGDWNRSSQGALSHFTKCLQNHLLCRQKAHHAKQTFWGWAPRSERCYKLRTGQSGINTGGSHFSWTNITAFINFFLN